MDLLWQAKDHIGKNERSSKIYLKLPVGKRRYKIVPSSHMLPLQKATQRVNVGSRDLHWWNVNVQHNVESSRVRSRAIGLWLERKDIMHVAICVDCLVKIGKCAYTGSEYHAHKVRDAGDG